MLKKRYFGYCHCKKIAFNFFSKIEVTVIKCDCSICSPTRFLHLIIPHKDFFLDRGKDYLKTYSFGTKSAIHYFCKFCGIKSFYQPRSHKHSYSINYYSIYSPPKIEKVIDFKGSNYSENIKYIKTI